MGDTEWVGGEEPPSCLDGCLEEPKNVSLLFVADIPAEIRY